MPTQVRAVVPAGKELSASCNTQSSGKPSINIIKYSPDGSVHTPSIDFLLSMNLEYKISTCICLWK